MKRVVHHVGVERQRAKVFESRGVVEVARMARVVDVEAPAARAGAQRHRGPPVELLPGQEAPAGHVEGPQLVVTNLLDEHVAALAPAGKREADLTARRRGTERKE